MNKDDKAYIFDVYMSGRKSEKELMQIFDISEKELKEIISVGENLI